MLKYCALPLILHLSASKTIFRPLDTNSALKPRIPTTTLSIKQTGADRIFNNRPALVPEIGSNHQASCLDYAGCVTETLISDWAKKANEKKGRKREQEREGLRELFTSGVFPLVIR